MVRLQVEPINVGKISILLAKYSVLAKVTETEIVLNGELSSEMLEILCSAVKILSFDNIGEYENDCQTEKEETSNFVESNFIENEDLAKDSIAKETKKISTVDVFEKEGGDSKIISKGVECNINPPTKKEFKRPENPELDLTKIKASDSVLELLNYCRTSADTKKKETNKKPKNKNFVPERSKKERAKLVKEEASKIRSEMLSLVDENTLKEIAHKKGPIKIKIQTILELFGFDMNRNGVEYLRDAIYYSLKKEYFNVDILSKDVSEKHGVEVNEVQRLLVARVKERFGFKKAPTLEFIRLVNSYLTNMEGA